MKLHFLLLMPLLLTGCHRSCPRGSQNHGGQVTSIGYGEIKVVPDMVRFTVAVSVTRPTVKEAMTETRKVMDEIVGLCKKSIPDSSDIRTAYASVDRDYAWANNSQVFKGYAATQAVEITLRDLSKLESLTEGLLNAHLTRISDFEFDHSKADSLRSAANVLAMLDAKMNVQKMCASVNLTCEELVSAAPPRSSSQGAVVMAKSAEMRVGSVTGGGISAQPGLIDFPATVEATYRAK